ncbi:hypothetical protein KUTeg_004017 [Tegillarca granosa]|uniref:G-protein coupled receptors family 1 profile domain-containing protein n=1 Tax=Tegillarca granosa TaxID=220873 RepID=A0ABQ9FRY0_TEGGR|nr:hypothetical protein KUTeg_004017 [Tegillarca granosa]
MNYSENSTNFAYENTSDAYFNISDNFYFQKYYPLIQHPAYLVALYSIAYGVLFIFGLLGNCMVITVVLKNPAMRHVTNYFVVNLAVADLMVTFFCIPLTLLDNVYTAVSLAVPLVVYYEKFDNVTSLQVIPMCHQLWPDFDSQRIYFVVALFLFCYASPLILIMLCYTLIVIRVWTRHAPGIASNTGIIKKSRVKVIKMFAVVVSMSALLWLPLYVLYFFLYFDPPSITSSIMSVISNIMVPIFQWMALSSSSINPIIYCIFSKRYRNGLHKLIYCRSYVRRLRLHRSFHSATTKYVPADGFSGNSYDSRRLKRPYSPARLISVDYSNGLVTVTFRRDRNNS